MCGAVGQLKRDSAYEGAAGSRNTQRELTSAKILDLITPTRPTRNACFLFVTAYTYGVIVFHNSRLTPAHCWFFICHRLRPRNACFPLVTAYTHALLVSGNHFVDFMYCRMYLSTTPVGSLQVKVIYYKKS